MCTYMYIQLIMSVLHGPLHIHTHTHVRTCRLSETVTLCRVTVVEGVEGCGECVSEV